MFLPNATSNATTNATTNADETGWIQTYTGGSIHPVSPRAEDICVEDIANALARQCRYAGHCLRFYSVAEHCVLLSDYTTEEHKLTALMHDASEAYLVDIPRPIKPLLIGYRAIEDRLMAVIANKFRFEWPLPAEVKRIDAAIITDERLQNMARMNVPDELWGSTLPALGVELKFWTPEKAAFEFLSRFYRLGGHL